MQPNDVSSESQEEIVTPAYLIFQLAGELYGTALLTIKEIIKMTAIKPTPYMVPYFKGVVNLRGQIVSIVDLRIKFGVKCEDPSKGLIIVVDTPTGVLGAIVDELVSVENIENTEVDNNPSIATTIPVDFFKGIAKLDSRLVTLVDISKLLSETEMRTIKKAA